LVDAARSLGFSTFLIDVSSVTSDAQLFDEVADLMKFPGYAGKNWDALLDSLRDMSWCPAPGYCVTLTGTDSFLASCRRSLSLFIDVMAQAAEDWRSDKVPFHLIVVGGRAVASFLLEEVEIRTARAGDFPLSRIGAICDESSRHDREG
jgi:RNAse (barnase) inhibitor barstar